MWEERLTHVDLLADQRARGRPAPAQRAHPARERQEEARRRALGQLHHHLARDGEGELAAKRAKRRADADQLVEKGLTKSIGISNFNINRTKQLLEQCTIKPVASTFRDSGSSARADALQTRSSCRCSAPSPSSSSGSRARTLSPRRTRPSARPPAPPSGSTRTLSPLPRSTTPRVLPSSSAGLSSGASSSCPSRLPPRVSRPTSRVSPSAAREKSTDLFSC